MKDLTFNQLREANKARLPHFKNGEGQPAHTKEDGSDWSIAEWTNALAGEVGEACNIAKKIRRGDFKSDPGPAAKLLLDELADAVIYADLCAQQLGASLGEAVARKFNAKSVQVGSAVRIDLP